LLLRPAGAGDNAARSIEMANFQHEACESTICAQGVNKTGSTYAQCSNLLHMYLALVGTHFNQELLLLIVILSLL